MIPSKDCLTFATPLIEASTNFGSRLWSLGWTTDLSTAYTGAERIAVPIGGLTILIPLPAAYPHQNSKQGRCQ